MFTHKGQGRGCVSHRVCAVEDHKTIVVFIVFLNKEKENKMWIIIDGSINAITIFLPYDKLYFKSNVNIIGLIDGF